MGGRGGSMGGSHGMGGGGSAGGAAKAPAQAAPQTRQQQLLAQIKGNPAALMQMSDQDALDTMQEIAKMPLPDDGTRNNTFLQRYLEATGLANDMPTVLDESAFETERQKIGARVLYHSDLPTDGTIASARKTQQQLQTGATAYASCGVHGSGTYLDTDATSNAICYGYGGTQVKLFINRNAKLARSSDLLQAESNFRGKHPKTYAYLQGLDKKLGKHRKSEIKTIYLTAAGYNVFSRPGGYKVAYSRKALTICNVMKDASTVTTNW